MVVLLSVKLVELLVLHFEGFLSLSELSLGLCRFDSFKNTLLCQVLVEFTLTTMLLDTGLDFMKHR